MHYTSKEDLSITQKHMHTEAHAHIDTYALMLKKTLQVQRFQGLS